ncbi:chaperone protein [Populus alba x Populus x berolinensis]|uniref:Chaperone protein n=1 Tax=Populus alba x Populus x berolinensis TaxID=444605 RepID=A0AAD6RDX6_9ROSI|nr:chaperone protein [Populus alba x Populus x berolinensis]
MMMWDDPQTQPPPQQQQQQQRPDQDFCFNFDLLSLLSRPKVVAFPSDFYFFCHIRVRNWQCMQDYYKILEVDYDATDDAIRSNYIRLALKWHPDKQKDEDSATSRFQEINEAYQVLSDPVRRIEYDTKGMMHIYDYNISEYLNRYKGLILTCNGLGIRHSIL